MEKITIKIPAKANVPVLAKPKLFFSSQDDENETEIQKINKDIIKASLYQQASSQGISKALAEDPTIFAYDLYKSKETPQLEEETVKNEAKYHEQIKMVADFKKKEREVIKERVEASQREKEKKEFGETEVYFTQSYLELMKSNKKFEETLKAEDLVSDLHSIKHKRPSAFLNNIISETVSKPYKKIKIEVAEPVKTIDKRSESEVNCAKERYLARKRGK